MAISHKDQSKDLRRITLTGRLDFHGVEEILDQLASLIASAGRNVVVDLTAVTVICSIGIRALILNTITIQKRGGRIALVMDENTLVFATLKSVGIETLLPVFMSFTDAENALLS